MKAKLKKASRNANFIAHARTDIPKLLNEIKILQEEVNRLKNAE